MTKIDHKDGAVVKDSFAYVLDDVGNVDSVTQVDDSVWDYLYDGRYRLTKATRDNATTSPTITATYEYTYDDGDNLLTKVTPFLDDFNDANYTGWTKSGTWAANSAGKMANTPTGATRSFWMSTGSDADVELRFSYTNEDTSNNSYGMFVDVRNAGGFGNRIRLELYSDRALLRQLSAVVWSDLDTDSGLSSTQDTEYHVRVVLDGTSVKVYRSTDGSLETEVLSGTTTVTAAGSYLTFGAYANSDMLFDNIWYISDNESSTTTFAYNNANELTKMTLPNGGSNIDFTYDLWGRMTKKKLGTTYEATYGYRYGHKLIDVTTDWPNEKDVDYEYGAQGKRRERTVDSVTTKYNWRSGTVVNEENSGGTLTRSFVGQTLGHVDGATPATGDYVYYAGDYLGSSRRLRDQNKDSIGESEFTPLGSSYTAAGAQPYYGFAQLAWDSAAQMHYAPFRYYSSSAARWISRDPMEMMDGSNMYSYVTSNPTSLIDPLGLLGISPSIQELMVRACKNAKTVRTGLNRFNPWWFKRMVDTNEPWDYKNSTNPMLKTNPEYGNWHYGVVCAALSIPNRECLRLAGWAQSQASPDNPAREGNPGKGKFDSRGAVAPYGDFPADQDMIQNGMDFFNSGACDKYL